MQDQPEPLLVPTRVYGGHCSGGGTLAATLGRFGVSPKRALERCAQETSTDWTNYKIDVVFHVPRLGARPVQQLRVDVTPSASAMVLRGSSYVPPDVADRGLILATLIKGGYECKTRSPEERKHKFKHEADIMAGTVYAIAKQQRVWKRSFARELVGTVKEVLGTCHSLGITVDGMKALAFQKEILEGRVVVPNEEAVPTFMREDGSGVETSLCKETYMSDEEKQAMKDKATAKMKEVRYRK